MLLPTSLKRSSAMYWALVASALWGASQEVLGQTTAPLEIGRRDHPTEAFGHVASVVVAADGRVYVADDLEARLLAFASDGHLTDRVGRRGQGPGEFVSIAALTLSGDGHSLAVLDPENSRVTRYAVDGGSLNYLGEARLPWLSTDMCAAGDRRFLLTHQEDDAVIREVDHDYEVLKSFAPPILPTAEQASEMGTRSDARLSLGHIVCDAERERLYHIATMSGIVRAFDLSGAALWDAQVEPFESITLARMRNGQCCVYRPSGTGVVSEVASATVDPDGDLHVSVMDYTVADRERRFRSVYLRAVGGSITSKKSWSIDVAGFTSRGPFGSSERRGFPQVIVY